MSNWLNFKKIASWPDAIITGFQYDAIPDEDIQAALSDPLLLHVESDLDWEDDRWLYYAKSIPTSKKHAYRVAALVKSFSTGDVMKNPISLDTFNMGQCASGIGNGHHRIRALQFLGLEAGPFELGGMLKLLEGLVAHAGTSVPDEFSHIFASELLSPSNDDVPPRPAVKRLRPD